ncbi:hypothetical protein KKB54_05395, partial [bacterium]|nr:hypothetical protein [bacterium]
ANEIGTASNSAEKKNRPREGVGEGGFGGNSATPEGNQIEDSPAVLLVQSRTPQNSFLFLLEEKNRRAQIKNCEENFCAGWRGFRATAGMASLLGGFCSKNVRTSFKKHRQVGKRKVWLALCEGSAKFFASGLLILFLIPPSQRGKG